ncbi:HAD family hydrolase [Deinococcus cellulosilyticus]|nr:HAD family hydrolase [Deinococcus cellulosilyticus]
MIPKVVFFDLDDTLLDHTGTSQKALQHVFGEQLAENRTSLEVLERMNSDLYDTLMVDVLAKKYDIHHARAERFRRMFEACGDSCTLERGHAAFGLYRSRFDAERTLIPGALEVLQALGQVTEVGIITNQPHKFDRDVELLQNLPRHWFVSGEVGLRKPDPALFKLAVHTVGCTPSEAVMVGDLWDKDVEGARNAGLRPVWINRFQLEAPDADIPQLSSYEPVELALRIILKA